MNVILRLFARLFTRLPAAIPDKKHTRHSGSRVPGVCIMVETTSNLAPTPRRQSQSAPATPRHPCEGTARGDAYDKGRLHMAMRRTARLHPVPRDLSTRPRLMPPMTKGTCSCRPCRPCPTKRLRLVTSPSSRWHTMARRTSPGTRLAVHGWRGGRTRTTQSRGRVSSRRQVHRDKSRPRAPVYNSWSARPKCRVAGGRRGSLGETPAL